MIGHLFIDDVKVGNVDFHIIDETMGVIGGELLSDVAYENYRNKIQELCEANGIANINDFNFKIILQNNILINPEGGIGVTDMIGFDEKYVESSGISSEFMKLFR
jgi:hypothetical protein